MATDLRIAAVVSSHNPLAPVAYNETLMPSLALAKSSRTARLIARVLGYLLVLTFLLMAFAPWQQSVTGAGSVVAFDPGEREQSIEAPTKGRIVSWGDDIFENARVTKGQRICEIQDLDEEYVSRINDQLLNTERTVTAAQQQLEASERAASAIGSALQAFESQLKAYGTVKTETEAALDAFVEMAGRKLEAEQQALVETQAALPQIEAELERTRKLHAEGNLALQKVQEVERKFNETNAKVKKSQAYVESAEAELEGKKRERVAKVQKAQVDIDYASTALNKAQGDTAKADSDVSKARQELNKAEKELLETQVKVARQKSQIIVAPFDGFVVNINPNVGTQIVKEGDEICTIVPDTEDRAAQVWMSGLDAPLISPGRHVRLQFEGWPAVQFAGYPSVAVGTFGGEVVSVDAIDNGKGKFRIIIRPDPGSPHWPEGRFLRQGVRVHAWVILEQVPLWFEFWRQMNGFPPVVDVKDASGVKSKPPKLPK